MPLFVSHDGFVVNLDDVSYFFKDGNGIKFCLRTPFQTTSTTAATDVQREVRFGYANEVARNTAYDRILAITSAQPV